MRSVSLHRRQQPAEEFSSALGAIGKARRDAGAPGAARNARAHPAEIAEKGLNNFGRIPDWDAITISVSPHLSQHAGRTIAALAAAQNVEAVDCVCDYLIADRCATRVLVSSIGEADIRTLIRAPDICVGSDGNCVAPTGITGQGMPHPRFYGTFPRIIGHYVRELGLLSLPAAIHKMAGAPARRWVSTGAASCAPATPPTS